MMCGIESLTVAIVLVVRKEADNIVGIDCVAGQEYVLDMLRMKYGRTVLKKMIISQSRLCLIHDH